MNFSDHFTLALRARILKRTITWDQMHKVPQPEPRYGTTVQKSTVQCSTGTFAAVAETVGNQAQDADDSKVKRTQLWEDGFPTLTRPFISQLHFPLKGCRTSGKSCINTDELNSSSFLLEEGKRTKSSLIQGSIFEFMAHAVFHFQSKKQPRLEIRGLRL